MSAKRSSLSRKRPTQVELERENSELKRRIQQLEKRLKQAVRQLRQYEDNESEVQAELEAEVVQIEEAEKASDDAFMVFVLANGQVKKVPKRAPS